MDTSAADHDLLRRFAEGSRESLDELVRRHLPMVYAAALREMGDPHLADDVTQAVFLVLMRRATTTSPNVVLAGWLFKTTRYVAADARKMAIRRARHEREAAMQSTQMQSDSDDAARLKPLLNAAIASLPAKYRDAVVMSYLQGKTHGEVAAAQQVTETAARQRLFRALQKLRDYCARHDVPIGETTFGSVLAVAGLQSPPPALLSRVSSTLTSPGAGAPAALAHHSFRSMMMFKLKISLAAVAVLLMVLTLVMPRLFADPVVSQPATQPTAPAPSPQADDSALTPQQILVHAFQSAAAGNVEKHLTYFHNLTPAQVEKQRKVAALLMAVNELAAAAGKKFGEPVGRQINAASGLDLSEQQLGSATVEINGDSATVDLHGSGPGKVPMIKTPKGWRISPVVIDQFNSVTADSLPPLLRQTTLDITSGKIATAGELFGQLRNAMR